MSRSRMGRLLLTAAGAACGILAAPSLAAALCGDLTADGRITVSDALQSLRAVVDDGYHPRGDLDAGSGADGALTVTDALGLLQAVTRGGVPPCATGVERTLLVGMSAIDFANGGLAEIDLTDFSIRRSRASFTDGDSVLRVQLDRVFVLNRFAANNVQEIDVAADQFSTKMQCSLGVGANPHDIALLTDAKGYVTRYDKPNLGVIDLTVDSTCNGFVSELIDLGPAADDDGIPEMDQSALVGDRLFVALQLLDRRRFFVPTGPGALAVIDVVSDELIDTIPLEISNPFAETKGLIYHEPSGRLYVAGPGTLFTNLEDGGIETVDVATQQSDGILMTGAELGGDLTDIVIVGTARAYAVVAGEGFVASLVEVDLAARTVVDVLATSEFSFSDIELSESGLLCLADRDPFEPGVRCWDIADNRELTSEPVYPGLMPFNLFFRP